MVRRVPGTDVSLNKDGAQRVFDNARERMGCCFVIWMIFFGPIFIGIFLGIATIGIANLVFAIQALVVGANTYQGPDCQRTIGQWLIVYGSLVLGSTVLGCCCGERRKDDESDEPPKGNICQFVGHLCGFAAFGWLCYGINIIYDNPGTYQQCNPSQWDVFHLIVMFMFWGSIAVLGSVIFLCCCIFPVIVTFADEQAGREPNNRQPDIEAQKPAETELVKI